jgi:hydroxymethylpyrimidine pyrophosphatase-like HAD family hydrolase
MRFAALATDYDGTIAHDGVVDAVTVDALARCRASGRALILVTGRELDELLAIFPAITLFERVVAENGALLYTPATGERRLLGDAPPAAFVETLRGRGVPLSVGGSIVATVQPHETAVLEAIRDLGLELKVVFNKGAVMVLPPAVNKATGLTAALAELALSPRNTVAVGDGENDHALLELSEYGVAVANAVPTLREQADFASALDHGKAVVELIDGLLDGDLAHRPPRNERRAIPLGQANGSKLTVPPHGTRLLIAGVSGSGQARLVRGVLASLARCGYQFCVLDAAGRFRDVESALVLGSAERAPAAHEVLAALERPEASLVIHLGALAIGERERYLRVLFRGVQALRARRGRPHWLVVDDAHHFLPPDAGSDDIVPAALPSLACVTALPGAISPRWLESLTAAAVLGEAPAAAHRGSSSRRARRGRGDRVASRIARGGSPRPDRRCRGGGERRLSRGRGWTAQSPPAGRGARASVCTSVTRSWARTGFARCAW